MDQAECQFLGNEKSAWASGVEGCGIEVGETMLRKWYRYSTMLIWKQQQTEHPSLQ